MDKKLGFCGTNKSIITLKVNQANWDWKYSSCKK